jgi:hypothetical protein
MVSEYLLIQDACYLLCCARVILREEVGTLGESVHYNCYGGSCFAVRVH